MPNFFGKKGPKSKAKEPPPAYTPFDFSTPDAFSEDNMAKVNSTNWCTAVCIVCADDKDNASRCKEPHVMTVRGACVSCSLLISWDLLVGDILPSGLEG